MRHLSLMLACFCVLVAPVRTLGAQTVADTATASFRQGEWGVGFILRSGVNEGGVLRFSTPTRAWVLDGSASYDRQSQSGSQLFADRNDRSWFLSGQFGPRWYHAVTGHVVRYLGLGVSGAYSQTKFSSTPSRSELWSLGAYGEAGMQYMITRYLGLGWRGTVTASRSETKGVEQVAPGVTNTVRAIGYQVRLDAVQLTGTIYF